MNLFRLVWIRTQETDRYTDMSMGKINFEYLGCRESIYALWSELKFKMNWPHVDIYNMDGIKQQPEKGINGLNINNA